MTALIHRLIIFNTCAAAAVAWAWLVGHVEKVTHADVAHMWVIISAVFLFGIVSTFRLAIARGKTLKELRHAIPEKRKRIVGRLQIRSQHLHTLIVALFTLGIIGNAIGILSGFGSIDMGAVGSAEGMQRTGLQVLSGATTTFGSTIVGATLALWTMVNVEMLDTALALDAN